MNHSDVTPRTTSATLRFMLRWLLLGNMLMLMWGCSPVANLETNLHDSDANEIVALLNHHGIEARKLTAKEGITLTVRESDVSRATDAMRAAGLPKRSLSNLGMVFKKEGMISTPLEERVRYIHALSQELEFTLQQFDHVISARVHVVLPERIAPGEPIQPSSAAVFVKYSEPFDEDTNIPRITNLVSSSIPGLSGVEGRSKVSVVLAPASSLKTSIEWEPVGPFTVQKDSVADLKWMLAAMALFCLLCVISIVLLLLSRTPFGKKLFAALQLKSSKKAKEAT